MIVEELIEKLKEYSPGSVVKIRDEDTPFKDTDPEPWLYESSDGNVVYLN
jgi:hypothetical protein